MNIIFILAPLSILLGLAAVAAFVWNLRAGQYEDVEGSAARILIDDPQLRAEMGDHARRYAEQNFSLANVIENHLYIYQSLTVK